MRIPEIRPAYASDPAALLSLLRCRERDPFSAQPLSMMSYSPGAEHRKDRDSADFSGGQNGNNSPERIARLQENAGQNIDDSNRSLKVGMSCSNPKPNSSYVHAQTFCTVVDCI